MLLWVFLRALILIFSITGQEIVLEERLNKEGTKLPSVRSVL